MDFLHRDVPAIGKSVHRLGLAANYGIDEAGIRSAIDRGVNYFFYTLRSGEMLSPMVEAMKRDREKVVVATLPLMGFFAGGVRSGAEKALKQLGTDYLDVFMLGWLGVTSALTDGVVKELVHLKESGKVRAIGCSIHDRPRAGKLAEEGPMDLLMIRYNAAHPGAEREIFPHLEKRKPAVVAYTATSWRKLLKAPKGFAGQAATAGDCYRFCLSNPHVDLVLTGPASKAELDENLAAVEKGPMSEKELAWMRELGKAVHGLALESPHRGGGLFSRSNREGEARPSAGLALRQFAGRLHARPSRPASPALSLSATSEKEPPTSVGGTSAATSPRSRREGGMGHSFSLLFIHIVWGTKDRAPLLRAELRPQLYAFLAGRGQQVGARTVAVGGVDDHVHALVELPRRLTVASIAQDLKGASAYALNHGLGGHSRFRWQEGYSAFTVSPGKVDAVTRYILDQERHHANATSLPELEWPPPQAWRHPYEGRPTSQ